MLPGLVQYPGDRLLTVHAQSVLSSASSTPLSHFASDVGLAPQIFGFFAIFDLNLGIGHAEAPLVDPEVLQFSRLSSTLTWYGHFGEFGLAN